ncbi:MAG: hypothetical protein JOZ57_02005, partial [Abitibacteriaceae bacterium]|nr:hypothetical protein [Abditibacteriaceae bacterium]
MFSDSFSRNGPGNSAARRCQRFLSLAYWVIAFSLVAMIQCHAQDNNKIGQDPATHLPPHIRRLTYFGERADWSHDGKRILFIEKTYGDVFEVEVATGIIRPVTHHYYHAGYSRALYLSNDDILLSGAPTFDPAHAGRSRWNDAELWILDKSLTKPPVRLGEKCSEGPAVSRTKLRIAWTIGHGQYPERLANDQSQMWLADIEYENGVPHLAHKKLILDNKTLPFRCSLETQNFRPTGETELTFSAYGYQGTEVMGLNLETGQVVNYSKAPNEYNEPEGIFPDGQYTLEECDRQN